MVNYECKLCEYKSTNKSNHEKHCNTKKHIANVQKLAPSYETASDLNKNMLKKSYECNYCKRNFSRIDNFSRHLKICVYALKKQDDYDKQKEEKEKLEDEVKYYRKLFEEASGLVKKSFSALTYSIHNYQDAPAIKAIEIKDISEFNKDKKLVVEDILYHYKHKTLGKYLGDCVLNLYKMNNPKIQSIWPSDVKKNNIYTYIIF